MDFKYSLNGNSENFMWTYTQNNITAIAKNIELSFFYGKLGSFADSWGIYSVSGDGRVVSEANAELVGFEAAKNFNLTLFQGPNLPAVRVYPDWSNMTFTARFELQPGHALDKNLTSLLGWEVYPSNFTRDPLTLYPYYDFLFLFSKPIGNIIGIEVAVWGDTNEVAYCTSYEYLGGGQPT